jgi:hypothetical protein
MNLLLLLPQVATLETLSLKNRNAMLPNRHNSEISSQIAT